MLKKLESLTNIWEVQPSLVPTLISCADRLCGVAVLGYILQFGMIRLESELLHYVTFINFHIALMQD